MRKFRTGRIKYLIPFLIIVVSLWNTNFVKGEDVGNKGKIFDLATQRLNFRMINSIETSGEKTVNETRYLNLKNEIVLVEKLILKNKQVTSFEVQQKQLNKHAKIKIGPKKLNFQLFDLKNGELIKKGQVERTAKPLGIGPTIFDLVKKNWKKLEKGDDVDFVLPLWARQDTVDFFLRKHSHNDESLIIKMLPSNFFVRQFVDTIYIGFNTELKKVSFYQGRTNLFRTQDKESEAFDGYIVLDSESESTINIIE